MQRCDIAGSLENRYYYARVCIYIYYNSKTAFGFLPVDVRERMKTPLNNANAIHTIYIQAFNSKKYDDRERVSHNIYLYVLAYPPVAQTRITFIRNIQKK